MSELTLYRGDAEVIESFQIKKTQKYSLLGPGIYLTDTKKIAETYREKGSMTLSSNTIYNGTAKNRTEAFELAFETFVYCETRKSTSSSLLTMFKNRSWVYPDLIHLDFKKLPKSFLEKMRIEYNKKIEEKQVFAEHIVNNNKSIGIKVISLAQEKIGYITEFKFVKEEFESSIFKIDGRMSNKTFWELMYQHRINLGSIKFFDNKKPLVSFETYMDANLDFYNSTYNLENKIYGFFGKDKIKTLKQIQEAMTRNGFKGLEYDGGFLTGGHGKHRAFCIWDNEYVNDNLIRRFQ